MSALATQVSDRPTIGCLRFIVGDGPLMIHGIGIFH